jgi:hypothetical protein
LLLEFWVCWGGESRAGKGECSGNECGLHV